MSREAGCKCIGTRAGAASAASGSISWIRREEVGVHQVSKAHLVPNVPLARSMLGRALERPLLASCSKLLLHGNMPGIAVTAVGTGRLMFWHLHFSDAQSSPEAGALLELAG